MECKYNQDMKHINEYICVDQQDELHLFSEELITKYPFLAIDVYAYHSKFMIGMLGWHYILDLIWTLEKLRPYGNGLRIMDAGGGMGLLQFILAEKRHAVVSIDAFFRTPPTQCKGIIPVYISGNQSSRKTDYVMHTSKNYHINDNIIPRAKNIVRGEIEFHCTDLADMPFIADDEFDAVVSISALEHNSIEQQRRILKELRRVTKKNAPLILTLSTSYDGTLFHEPSHSYLYGEDELKKTYGLSENLISNFSEISCYRDKLFNSIFLRDYLSSFYFQGAKNGMPHGLWDPKYIPFGLFHLNKK